MERVTTAMRAAAGVGAAMRAAAGVTAALSLLVVLGTATPARAMYGGAPGYGGVPLPPAWELCVLAGVGAPATRANVADLDVWQMAEGGSTEDANTYNPYNTRRPTDSSGAPLPETMTSEGFPAFDNWPAGCAATVATILQPNMAPIAANLVGGGSSSPAAYLEMVDTTPWCAPDNGTPCYTAIIDAGAEPADPSEAIPLLTGTSASLATYGQQVDQVVSIEQSLEADDQALVAAKAAVAVAQRDVQTALLALRNLALYEYTSNNQIDQDLNLKQFEAPDQNEELGQYYEGIDATNQTHAYAEAQAVLAQAQSHQAQVTRTLLQTDSALTSAQDQVVQTLGVLAGDVGSFQRAGACGGVPAAAMAEMVGPLQGCVNALVNG